MYRIVFAVLLVLGIFTARVTIGINDYETEKLDVYYNTGTVVSTGQCNKTECAYTVRTSGGTIVNASSYDPVSIGQIVYQKCWTERVLGSQCYVNYRPSKQ